MGTLRFFEEVVSFKIRRTFGFADYKTDSSNRWQKPNGQIQGITAISQLKQHIPISRRMHYILP